MEIACDAAVLAGRDGEWRRRYGAALLSFVPVGRPAPLTSQFAGGARGLKERFRALMDASAKRPGRAALLLVLCAALLGGPLVACQSRAPEESLPDGTYWATLSLSDWWTAGEEGIELLLSLVEVDTDTMTLLRVALVPLYLVLLWFFDNDKSMQIWPLLVFALASLTDLLDGYIARSRNLITNFGKFMDPIADKLLTHTTFIMLTAIGRLNVTACIIFIAREFVVSGLRLCAVEQGHVIAAGMSGKIKTVLQMMLVVVLTITGEGLLPALLTIAASVMTLYSMGEYVWQNRAVLSGAK